MKSARVFSYAFALLICASSATYAQGGQDKKGGPPDDKHGDQAKAANPGHGRENKAPPPAHAQPAARQQHAQTPPPAQAKASPRAVAAVQRQRVQQAPPNRVVRAPAPQSRIVRNPAPPPRAARPVVLPVTVQRQRTQIEQQRAVQYRQRLAQQVNFSQQQAALLQQQRRINQYRAEQQYLAQLRQQQVQLQRARNYANDPYIQTAPSYRYGYSGVTRETNQYGADVLRQAVNDGYQEGVRFGQADRADGYPANYTNNAAYRDANYGYSGNYVDQSDYNYYFRQGFQRGYTDGFNSQSQYGSSLNGQPSILSTLLTSILGLTSLR